MENKLNFFVTVAGATIMGFGMLLMVAFRHDVTEFIKGVLGY